MRPRTRFKREDVQRFKVLRELVMPLVEQAVHISPGEVQGAIGPVLVSYRVPRSETGLFNLVIWLTDEPKQGCYVRAFKVADVDWDNQGTVRDFRYQRGPWEDELLTLMLDRDDAPVALTFS